MIDTHRWFFLLFIWIIPTLTAICWRESLKARLSQLRGDSTAMSSGLGSFAIYKNLHPIGSALSPLILILKHTDIYAWAKKVDVRSNFLKLGRTDCILILSAAIVFNFLFATVWAWVAHFAPLLPGETLQFLVLETAKAGIKVNLVLFTLHLLPLPPMDMSNILREFMPRYPRSFYSSIDAIGHYIIFFVLLLDYGQKYLDPVLLYLEHTALSSMIGFAV